MNCISDRFVALLDANILYPFRKRDILLSYSHKGLFRARWTHEILDEWSNNLLSDKPELTDSILSQQQAMLEYFPEALVINYNNLSHHLNLPDKNDNHVLAAAIKCNAQHIITDNLKGFPNSILEQYDTEAISADEFIFRTSELYETEAISVMRELIKKYKNPAFTVPEFIMDLNAKGLPKFASWLQERKDLL